MTRRRREPPRDRPDRGPVDLAALWRDPRYLEIKERLGEPLAPSERATLEAHRGGGAARTAGDAPSAPGEGGAP